MGLLTTEMTVFFLPFHKLQLGKFLPFQKPEAWKSPLLGRDLPV